MSRDVYQLIDLQRVDPPEKPLKTRKTRLVEIYKSSPEGQARAQADRCLSCDNPYCKWKYPIHNYIPNWLKLANEGRIFKAVELSHQTNTLPKVYGRACPQDRLCEGSCTLNNKFGAVTTGNIKRYINDKALEMNWYPNMSDMKQTGKKIAIIGAGSTGLACADVLTRNGIKAIVFDRYPEIGGLLTFGVPASKLEKEVVTHHRKIFTGMGIEFKLNTGVDRDVQLDDLLSDYGTMFLSVGAYQSIRDGLGNEDVGGMYTTLPFLIANIRQLMGFGKTCDGPFVSMEGKRVVVLGDGDTAMDCVHMSIRQGARHVTYAYRRDEENIPGSRRGVKNAWEEGVGFEFNVQPLGMKVNGNGKVSGIKTVRIEMDEPGARGRRRAGTVAGSEHAVPADVVIMAFSFHLCNMEWLVRHGVELDPQGRIIAPEDNDNAFQTSNPETFVNDDIVRDSDPVVTAIAEGRRVANGIMNWLRV